MSLAIIPAASASAQTVLFSPFGHNDPAYPQPAPLTEQQPGDMDSGSDQLPTQLRRQVVPFQTGEAPGIIIIDTAHTFLYLTLGEGRALRYGIGVGREGFTWSGVETIVRKAEWPDWIPPTEMIARQPYLPRWVAGGPGNPLGARALYLGNTEYRIHGTNDPTTIGKYISSGCIRLRNEDVIDLYNRVGIGTKVVVLPSSRQNVSIERHLGAPMTATIQPRPAAYQAPAASQTPAGSYGLY